MSRRSTKHWGALLAVLVILTLMLSGCGSFFSEKEVSEGVEGQLTSEVTVDVKEMEFGHLMVSQFVVQEVKGLVGAEKFVLLTSDAPEGMVAALDEPLYVFNVKGDVTLAVLAGDNRVLGKTVVPAGNFLKTYDLFAPKEAVVVKDLTPVLEKQSLVGAYLADGELQFTGEEDVEETVVLRMGNGETNLDNNFFVINDIAIEMQFAMDNESRFNALFSDKFSEVDYDFENRMFLYIYTGNVLTNAKTSDTVDGDDKDDLFNSLTKIYNANNPNGLQRATANVTYTSRTGVNNVNVFEVTVNSVVGVRRATGYTILEPNEAFTNFGAEITRSANSDTINFYILGGDTDDFAGGVGSQNFPYLIANAEHLYNMRYYMDEGTYFKLTADIDLADFGEDLEFFRIMEEGLWTPIGSYANPFQGVFDGAGYEISNMKVERPDRVDVGLFGYIGAHGQIDRLYLDNVEVVGMRQVGALAGRNRGIITGSVVTNGTVTGQEFVGGLVGANIEGGRIENGRADVTVTGEPDDDDRYGNFVGGLVGANSSVSYIEDSVAEGAVSGVDNVGGLAGSNDSFAEIRGSSATGAVTGSGEKTGGLVGLNSGSDIERSFATGAVSGNGLYVGGLVGLNEDRSKIDLCYATGAVTSTNNTVGGLVGMNWEGEIDESYATGNVIGVTNVGGLVGVNWELGIIEDSYATGTVSGSGNRVGGFVGRNDHIIEGSWYQGGNVSGSGTVGLFIGVNWFDGKITGCHASGTGVGTFIGDNRNTREADVILPFNITDYFGANSAAVAKNGVRTDVVLNKAPETGVTLYIAPAGTAVADLDHTESHITRLIGNGTDIRVEVPKDTRNDYKVVLLDTNSNKVESSATLMVQNVDDVLFYDEEWDPAVDPTEIDYRSAQVSRNFVLDLAPVQGVTAWIAPAGTTRSRLRDNRDDMSKLVGSTRLANRIIAPAAKGTEYKVFLVDAYNNAVESSQFIVVGDIANEDSGSYFITLEHAITHPDTLPNHTIKLYTNYTIGQEDATDFEEADSNPLVEDVDEDPLAIGKPLTIDLNRNTLTFAGRTIEITANDTVIKNGKVSDAAVFEVTGANRVKFEDVEFVGTVDVEVNSDLTFDRAIFHGNVTVLPSTGDVKFTSITLGRNVTLEGDDQGTSTITDALTIESNRVRINNVTFKGNITVDGERAVFEDVALNANLKVYGKNNLTIRDSAAGDDTQFGNDVELHDVIFNLANGLKIGDNSVPPVVGGSNVYILRGEFREVGTLSINGDNLHAVGAVFKNNVTIDGEGKDALFENAIFEGTKTINLSATVNEIEFNTSFYGNITITQGTVVYSGVKMKNNLTIQVQALGKLVLEDDMDIENNTVTIAGAGEFDGKGNEIKMGPGGVLYFNATGIDTIANQDDLTIANAVYDWDSLVAQLAAAAPNDTLIFVDDVVAEATRAINESVIIDLNGHKLSDAATFTLSVEGPTDFRNGTINAQHNDLTISGVAKFRNVTFEAGTLDITEDVTFNKVTLKQAGASHDVADGKKLTLEGDLTLVTGTLNLNGAGDSLEGKSGVKYRVKGAGTLNVNNVTVKDVTIDDTVTVTLTGGANIFDGVNWALHGHVTLAQNLTLQGDAVVDLKGNTLSDNGAHTLIIEGATVKNGTINTTNNDLAISGASTFENLVSQDGNLTITADVVFNGVTLTAGTHTTTHKVTLQKDLTISAGTLTFQGAATAELVGGGKVVQGGGSVVFNHASAKASNVTFRTNETAGAADGVTFTDVKIDAQDGPRTVTVSGNATFTNYASLGNAANAITFEVATGKSLTFGGTYSEGTAGNTRASILANETATVNGVTFVSGANAPVVVAIGNNDKLTFSKAHVDNITSVTVTATSTVEELIFTKADGGNGALAALTINAGATLDKLTMGANSPVVTLLTVNGTLKEGNVSVPDDAAEVIAVAATGTLGTIDDASKFSVNKVDVTAASQINVASGGKISVTLTNSGAGTSQTDFGGLSMTAGVGATVTGTATAAARVTWTDNAVLEEQ